MDPMTMLVAFCLSVESARDVAQEFADGNEQRAGEVFLERSDCHYDGRVYILEEPLEVVEVVSGEDGLREIGRGILAGEVVYSWRPMPGEGA